MESYHDILGVNVDDIVKKGQFATEKRRQKIIRVLKRLLCLLIIICLGSGIFRTWYISTKNTQAVRAIEEAINNIKYAPKESTAAISLAMQLYDDLTEEQKSLIPNAPVQIVEEAINSIKYAPKESTAAISLAMQFYDDLTEEQKSLIPNAPVQIVEEAINSIGTITIGSKELIALSYEIYSNLPETQKSLVSNYEILKNARSTYIHSYKM